MIPMNNGLDFIYCIEKGCESWRQGDDMEGAGWFQQACILWLDTLEQMALIGLNLPEDGLKKLNQSFTLMLTALNECDIIRATDVIEYEILPIARSFNFERKE